MTDALKNNILCMIQKGIKQVEISRLFGISKSTSSRRKSLCEITAKLNGVTPVKVSRRTVQRELHAVDYFKRTVAKKLGVKEVNRKKRLQ